MSDNNYVRYLLFWSLKIHPWWNPPPSTNSAQCTVIYSGSQSQSSEDHERRFLLALLTTAVAVYVQQWLVHMYTDVIWFVVSISWKYESIWDHPKKGWDISNLSNVQTTKSSCYCPVAQWFCQLLPCTKYHSKGCDTKYHCHKANIHMSHLRKWHQKASMQILQSKQTLLSMLYKSCQSWLNIL